MSMYGYQHGRHDASLLHHQTGHRAPDCVTNYCRTARTAADPVARRRNASSNYMDLLLDRAPGGVDAAARCKRFYVAVDDDATMFSAVRCDCRRFPVETGIATAHGHGACTFL